MACTVVDEVEIKPLDSDREFNSENFLSSYKFPSYRLLPRRK